jgi:hypothetical protein
MESRVKISSIVESQLPSFVRDSYPLVSELLGEYYKSLEAKGSSFDILQNIDQYVKVNNLTNLVEKTSLINSVDTTDTTIDVSSTKGFPDTYGIIRIDDEIILYKSKTETQFIDCQRGFSSVVSYAQDDNEDLVFSDSLITSHSAGTNNVTNIGSLFLKEFFKKTKSQYLFGFEERELFSGINKNIALKQSKDFYSSKGSEKSFEVLFRILYGKDVNVILPKDFLLKPSDASYRVSRNFVVEPIQGNLEDLENKTIFQNQFGFIPRAYGTVNNVKRNLRNGILYYTLSVDFDFDKDIIVSGSIFGDLKVNPKTKLIDNSNISSTKEFLLTVDSTIGFEQSGNLVINQNGIDYSISYTSKTINQFLNCSSSQDVLVTSGSEVSLDTFAYGISSDGQSEIRFRITGVLSEVDTSGSNFYYQKGDEAVIANLGFVGDSTKDNNWKFNSSVSCDVKSTQFKGNDRYRVETFDFNGIEDGDSIEIDYLDSSNNRSDLIVSGENVEISTQDIPGFTFTISGISLKKVYKVRRLISKFDNTFISNVSNVYKDFDGNFQYVAASSLPQYSSSNDFANSEIVITNPFTPINNELQIVSFGSNHGLLTGDQITYYSSSEDDPNDVGLGLTIVSGTYYVKKISNEVIKISRSRSDIARGKFLEPAKFVGGLGNDNNPLYAGTISLKSLTKTGSQKRSKIDTQKLVRIFSSPIFDENTYETNPGCTGIFLNGVEIKNYKTEDRIYYGELERIDVISGGKNYDIINPPELKIQLPTQLRNISESSKKQLTPRAYPTIEGSLDRINIIDGGFDYIDTPIITITGGSGSGAKAVPNMISFDYEIDLNSSATNSRLDLSLNRIGFSTYHKFRDSESVIYKTSGNTNIGGLSTDAKYYVNVIDDHTITLHNNFKDAENGINAINLTSYGVGNHKIQSTERKQKINSIKIIDSGSGYRNSKIVVNSSGISTSNRTLKAKNLQFNDKEIVEYNGVISVDGGYLPSNYNIAGLSTSKKYIVTKIDPETFKLSEVGIGETEKYFFYNTNQYVDLGLVVTSNLQYFHEFQTEPIKVTVNGILGVSTVSTADLTAKIDPIFYGEVTSAQIYYGGAGYGSIDSIINYIPQPEFSFGRITSNAIAEPIVSKGKIIAAIVNERGSGYTSPPLVKIRGFGVGAILTPIVEDGEIKEIKVINGGTGYGKETTIEIVDPKKDCVINFYPKSWQINQFERLVITKKINPNDGILYRGLKEKFGIQYTHGYAPRPLRKTIFSEVNTASGIRYVSDYQNDKNSVKYHSPIIGWCYDGNPIYGPYGFNSTTDKTVKRISSGYELKQQLGTAISKTFDGNLSLIQNRPPLTFFPTGFFVEDYEYKNSGDLDIHNGRYCITPEFPQGIYAYFTTISESDSSLSGFNGDKIPVFPYIIGNTYKSKPFEFNFDPNSNQEDYDLDQNNLLRNTFPLNIGSKTSKYEYLLNNEDLITQESNVINVETGEIDGIKIISSGDGYKVGDSLIFNNKGTNGNGAQANVRNIKGKFVDSFENITNTKNGVEFYKTNIPNKIIGFATEPHKLTDGNLVLLNSLSNYKDKLNKQFSIGIRSDNFILNIGVGNASATGISTYFYVYGILDFPNIRENDILKIGSEDVKVLNVDKRSSRIKVLREQNSTVSSAHSAYTVLYEDPRKFTINVTDELESFNFRLNKEYYFDPEESLGIGTVGAGVTIAFSNPGIGETSVIVPIKSIYIKDHDLRTGDRLLYNSNSGIGITVSNTVDINDAFTLEDNQELYVARISNDLIGISSTKVGFGSDGDFVGIQTTNTTLYFVDPGSGKDHSFKTIYNDVLSASLTSNIVTVSTGLTQINLKENDVVYLNVKKKDTLNFSVKYDTNNRRLVINERQFSNSNVSVLNDTIRLENHGYNQGQKVIFNSSNPPSELTSSNNYYVIVFDKDNIRLSNSKYNTISPNIKNIEFSSQFDGSISPINPPIIVEKDQKVFFDLSDSSLSKSIGFGRTTSFEFTIYTDSNFKNDYFPINSSGISKILKNNLIGFSGASLSFTVDEEFPKNLYYNLKPLNSADNSQKNISNDLEVDNYNKISFIDSKLSGKKVLIGVTTNTFKFSDLYYPDSTFNGSNSSIDYYTTSKTENGPINEFTITSGGKSYKKLPYVERVVSAGGTDAILIPQSKTIGKIQKAGIKDIGANYSSDKTLLPLLKFPSILRIEPLTSIESIEVIEVGKDYSTNPNLILIDGFTKEVVPEVLFKYDPEKDFVEILRNTKGIYNATPRLVPTNNSNGVGILSIEYDQLTKLVTLFLSRQFSTVESFPFKVGQKVLVEGVSIKPNQNSSVTTRGYNSSRYNYTLFTVSAINPSIGGSGAFIKYSMTNLLGTSEITGEFDVDNSAGRVISEDDFPKFDIKLKKNEFFIGETVTAGNSEGIVQKFEEINEYLTVKTKDKFLTTNLLLGKSSDSLAAIREVFEYETTYSIDSSSVVTEGWKNNTGFLNDNSQRLQDSDYYQLFSYSLKSEVEFNDWNSIVSNLNHTLGYRRFGDLELNSTINTEFLTEQNEGDVSALADLTSITNIDAVYDYDLATEDSFLVEGVLTSDEITFDSVFLLDFAESKGNRVLLIDDISSQFNTATTVSTTVTTFSI